MNKIRIGNEPLATNYSFRPSVNRAFTDTGTTFVLLPEDDYFTFVDTICRYLETNGKG